MNELTRESCLCHWGFKKGEERPGHKYFARIASAIPGRFRYFYSKSEYDAYKNGGRAKKSGWQNNLDMVTSKTQVGRLSEDMRRAASDNWDRTYKKMGIDVTSNALKARNRDLKNGMRTSKIIYKERALQDKDLKKQHVREINETRKKNFRDSITFAKETIKGMRQQIAAVKASDLSSADKSVLIRIGKKSIKSFAFQAVMNVLLNELTGVSSMIDRSRSSKYLRDELGMNYVSDLTNRKNTRIKPARQTTYQKR